MKKLSRREAMGTIITAGAGVTLAGMTEAAAQIPAAPAFRGQHQIKPLPFDPAKLNGIRRSSSVHITRTTTVAPYAPSTPSSNGSTR